MGLSEKVKNAFNALVPILNSCTEGVATGQTSYCRAQAALVMEIRNILISQNKDVSQTLLSFEGGLYAEEADIASIFAGFGGNTTYQGYTITYRPPTATTSASLSFKKGADLVTIEAVSVSVDVNDDPNLPTVERNGIIYVKIGDKEIPLGEMVITKENRIAVAKIIAKYAAKLGFTGRVGLGYSNAGVPDKIPAFENDGRIFINDRGGKIATILSNKNVLLSVLYHEKLHTERNKPQSFYDHALIYYDQVTHSSFKDIPEDVKVSIIGGFCQRVINHLVDKSGTNTLLRNEMIEKINNFNALNTGYTLSHNFLNVLREEAYTITIIKGNRQWTVKFDPTITDYNK